MNNIGIATSASGRTLEKATTSMSMQLIELDSILRLQNGKQHCSEPVLNILNEECNKVLEQLKLYVSRPSSRTAQKIVLGNDAEAVLLDAQLQANTTALSELQRWLALEDNDQKNDLESSHHFNETAETSNRLAITMPNIASTTTPIPPLPLTQRIVLYSQSLIFSPRTPLLHLYQSSLSASPSTVSYLLSLSISPNPPSAIMASLPLGIPLQAAAVGGSVTVVQLLLAHGAHPNTLAGKYGTALHAAAFWSRVDIARLLLQKGADVRIQAGKYGSVLSAALDIPAWRVGKKGNSRKEMVRLLVGAYCAALE